MKTPLEIAETIADNWCSEWRVLDRERFVADVAREVELAVAELRAEVESLRQQLAEMRKALEPFVKAFESVLRRPDLPMDDPLISDWSTSLERHHVFEAAKALTKE